MNLLVSGFRTSRRWLSVLAALFIFCGLPAGCPGADDFGQLANTHPCLLLNSNGIAELKERIATAPWAKESWSELRAAADKALARPVDLPPRGGNWSHNYVCPTHGARLSQGKQLGPWQWEHICPVGRHILRGDPSKATLDFDGNAISSAHAKLAQQMIDHGLVYQVTGDARHARKAHDLLLAYAQRYLEYPLHDNQGKPGRGGRVASQSLTEASWLIEMAQGADLIWTTLTDAERQTVAEKLFRPALEQVILPHPLGIHNIQCRHNSAIGLVGFLLGDRQLIARAIDDPRIGFRQQIEKGVLADGMWCEGASGYHFFTIGGLWQLAEAARNCGIDLYSPKFQSMFDGPLALAMPDFVLPNFNDSGTVPLQNQDEYYELAYARFHRAAYLPLLAGSERHSRLALLYGASQLLPADALTGSASHNSEASGYAILQRGQGKAATWLCLKYGPHGGGHGHPDKNTFVLCAQGQILAPDAGTHAYGSPLHRDWDKTTLAHNTLVVDEESQAPATGKCLAFGSVQDVDYCISEAGPIYKGVTFTRTAAMLNSNLIVFVDQVRAEAPHTFDLAYHQIGQWEKAASSAPAFAAKASAPGYSQLSQTTLRRLDSSDGLTLRTQLRSDCAPAIIMASNALTEVITGYGILKTTEDLVPIVIQRQRAQQSTFVWAIALDGAPVTLRTAQVNDVSGKALPSTEAVRVEVAGANRKWSLLVNPQGKSVNTALANGGFWRTEARFNVR